MANPLTKMKLHQFMGWIYLLKQPMVIALSGTANLMIMLIYSHMLLIQVLQHPSYQVPYQQPMLVSGGHHPYLLGYGFQGSLHTTLSN